MDRTGAADSRSDLDRGDDRRLARIRCRYVLEIELERLLEVCQGALHGLTLACDLNLEAAGDIPRRLMRDSGREAYRRSLLDTPAVAPARFAHNAQYALLPQRGRKRRVSSMGGAGLEPNEPEGGFTGTVPRHEIWQWG